MKYKIQLAQYSRHSLAVVRRQAEREQLSKIVPDACGTVWDIIRQQGVGRLVEKYHFDLFHYVVFVCLV